MGLPNANIYGSLPGISPRRLSHRDICPTCFVMCTVEFSVDVYISVVAKMSTDLKGSGFLANRS